MATLKQIEANRLNAQKSTGPTSTLGKATSSWNAFKSGLYTKAILAPGEDWNEFEALLNDYHFHYLAQSPAERDLVDQLIRDSWQLRRFDRVEAQMWADQLTVNSQSSSFHENTSLGQVFGSFSFDERLARLHRMMAATKRSFRDALRELERLQKARREEEAETEWDDPLPDTDPPRHTLNGPITAPLTPIGFLRKYATSSLPLGSTG